MYNVNHYNLCINKQFKWLYGGYGSLVEISLSKMARKIINGYSKNSLFLDSDETIFPIIFPIKCFY